MPEGRCLIIQMRTMRRPWEAAGFWAVVATVLIATGAWIHESSRGDTPAPSKPALPESRAAIPIEVAPEAEPAKPHGAILYHGNTNTRRFHQRTCRYFNCPNCTAKFTSREDAIAAGYRPCGTCRP